MNENEKMPNVAGNRVNLRQIDFVRPQTIATFGAEIIEVSTERALLRYAFRPEWCNPRGSVQGGMLCVFLSDAIVYALLGRQDQVKSVPFAAMGLSTHFLRPITQGCFDAIGTVIRIGAKMIFAEATIVQGEKLIAKASSTLIFISSLSD